MAEYIEREALKQRLLEKGFYPAIVKSAIESIPAADVVEVRHGKWVPDYDIFVNEPFDTRPDRMQTGWKCSLCGRVECLKEPYCHCGAKMDGKDGAE